MRRSLSLLLLVALLAGCQASGGYRATGFVGAMDVNRLDVEVEPSLGSSTSAERSSFPMVGGSWAVPFDETDGGLEWGLEAGFSWGAKWDSADLVIDGSLVADNDYTLIDVFGGPYVSLPLARRLRLSLAAGPLLAWSRVELTFDPGGPDKVDEEGLGYGAYARAGLDFDLGRGTWAGLGLRVSDATLILDDVIEQVDVSGTELYLALTFSY